MKTYIKDKNDFLNNYEKFKGMVFYKEIKNKIHIRIVAPVYVKEIKSELLKIKL